MRLSALALAGVVTVSVICQAVAADMETQGYYQVNSKEGHIEVTLTEAAAKEKGPFIGDILIVDGPKITATFGKDCVLSFRPSTLGVLTVEDTTAGSGTCPLSPIPRALHVKQ
ncbi:hypothetical protein [Pseudomonas sp. BE134]|uniref:hypothetical protein n=1 Tax=Pseudomonas sp. BE134 TaxID=2817843 RepID=UPI00285727C4|nr:hypothetical protein [Pseudomonas sp. BE134]MDR6924794.1 hypothetical protein [Pseudomonas sp. BE134]